MPVTVTRTDMQDRHADESRTYRNGHMLALPAAKPGAEAGWGWGEGREAGEIEKTRES